MPDASLRQVRAQVTVTVEGAFSGAPTEDVRAALARSIPTNGDADRVHVIGIGEVLLLDDGRGDAPTDGGPNAFRTSASIEALAARQGVGPAVDFDQLLGDFWPADEDADDVISTIRRWRRDEG